MSPSDIKTGRKVGLYIRVSTERQAKVVEGSLKNQKQMLLAELERRNAFQPGWGVLVDEYIDEGLSAKTTNRTQFQRMLRDIEIGRIDGVMFTELSRFSRSLKDFLNIFEFVTEHNCDLICLKTEIDTTSPYSALVTKILMVFAEFEREMTAERTRQNAYERAKRGLHTGGRVSLGYKRDPIKKGHLLIEAEEARVVKEIFKMFCGSKTQTEILRKIKTEYCHIKKLRSAHISTINNVLNNKSYLGIKTIYPGTSKEEEVKGEWSAMITPKAFQKAQRKLKANLDIFSAGHKEQNIYYLSEIIHCGRCNEKLRGTSSISGSGIKHTYYGHKSICKKGGPNRFDQNLIDEHFFNWIKMTIESESGSKNFVECISQNIVSKIEKIENTKEIPVDYAKYNTEILLRLLENQTEILNIKSKLKDLLLLNGDALKKYLESTFSKIVIGENDIQIEGFKIDLATEVFDLLEIKIDIPNKLKLYSMKHMRQMFSKEGLSIRAISERLGVGRKPISEAIEKFGIRLPKTIAGTNGQMPYGWNLENGKLEMNEEEQKVLGIMKQLRENRQSYQAISKLLNENLIPTKNRGVWHAQSVIRVLETAEKMSKNP